MKKTRYTEEQIAFVLKQVEIGTRVGEDCRNMSISEATFYNWKKKFACLVLTELRHLRQLEDETHRIFPEWQYPQRSSIPIRMQDIFRALGRPPEEAEILTRELMSKSQLEQLTSALI